MLIGLTLLALPAGASAQEVGVTFQVRARPAQPDLVVDATSGFAGAAARVPGGWAYGVSRGVGGGAGSVRLAAGVAPSDSVEVSVRPIEIAGEPGEPVTVMFVPL